MIKLAGDPPQTPINKIPNRWKKKLNIYPECFKLSALLFIQLEQNKTPGYFADFFVKTNQVSIRTTRQSSNL